MTQNQGPVVSSFSTSSTKHAKSSLKWVIVTVVAVIIIIIIIIYLTSGGSKKTEAQSNACSNPNTSYILKEASSAFASNNLTEQGTLAQKITSLAGYKQDPNCMYILSYYYINLGNLKAASSSIDQLQKVYSQTKGYNSQLADALTVQQLKDSLSMAESSQKNSGYLTPIKNNYINEDK